MAKMITKSYKKGAFYEFHDIRHKLWKIQFIVLITVSSLAFASTILLIIREKYNSDVNRHQYEREIKFMDDTTFYLFMCGIYKGLS